MLQSSQSIVFATESPWTDESGGMGLRWEIGCESDDTDMVLPGTVVGTTAEGCDCLCDVDGLFRACGAEDCQ